MSENGPTCAHNRPVHRCGRLLACIGFTLHSAGCGFIFAPETETKPDLGDRDDMLASCKQGNDKHCRIAALLFLKDGRTLENELNDPDGAVELYQTACDLGEESACTAIVECRKRQENKETEDFEQLIEERRKQTDKAEFAALKDKCTAGDVSSCIDALDLMEGSKFASSNRSIDKLVLLSNACSEGSGQPSACFELGDHIVGESEARACDLFKIACEKGEDRGCTGSEWCGRQKAKRTDLEIQCTQKDGAACEELGNMWRDGRGGDRDWDTAVEYYDKACKLRNNAGCMALKKSE